jgi:signal transduction histidine kinase
MRSILKKFLTIFIIVLGIGFLILSTGTSKIIESYLIDQKELTLIEHGETFQKLYDESSEGGFLDVKTIQDEVKILSNYIGANLWVVNKNGEVYIADNKKDMELLNQTLKYDDIKDVFQGKIIRKISNYHNILLEPNLSIGYPISLNGEVQFALFMNVPIPEIQNTAKDINRFSIIALNISVIIAFILLVIFTSSMEREIKNISEAAHYVSEGNFDKKIRSKRGDVFEELAESFNQMAVNLQELESTKERFISNLSHDLRSPLTSITGYTRGLIDGTIPEENQEKYLKIVLEESTRLTKLTNDLLDLSKMQSGNISVNKTDFDINQMIIHELDKFEQRIEEKDIQISLKLMEERVLAHGDYEGIRRVVYNLMDNAVKFVDKAGTIEIKTENKEDKILVGIKNSGAYIPKEKLNTIWQRFSKMDDSRGIEKKSNGLGLSIIKEIIKAHDEKIDVYSSEEFGVVFIFSISTQIFK